MFRRLSVLLASFLFSFLLPACGGGDEEYQAENTQQIPPGVTAPVTPPVVTPPTTTPLPVVTTPPTVTAPPVVTNPTPVMVDPVQTNTTCVAGSGVDYQVGPGKAYTHPDQVPWENLKAGDTVRIFYSSTPYSSKFMISAMGTATNPVRICGVKGVNGERPIVTGDGATSRTQLFSHYSSTVEYRNIIEDRAIISIKASNLGGYTDTPSYIKIDGLHIKSATPSYSYTDSSGVKRNYAQFNACVWIDRGHNITLSDNEISDCSMALFSRSTDDGDFAVTKNISVLNNSIHGHGVSGSEREHSTYTASHGVVFEGNKFGPLRQSALGNSIKDRSVGLVVRYNYIEEGARCIDMVEAEDFPAYALAQSQYRATYVYGNICKKSGDSGSFFHYGGDHFGALPTDNWGERLFRQGTLYFYNNTVIGTGTSAKLFQLSTSLETLQAWNNVFWFESTVIEPRLVQQENDTLSKSYVGDGTLIFGKNWIKSGWVIVDQWHTTTAKISGTENFVTGSSIPFDPSIFRPLAGSALIDAAQTTLTGASQYPVNKQWTSSGIFNRTLTELGAIEY